MTYPRFLSVLGSELSWYSDTQIHSQTPHLLLPARTSLVRWAAFCLTFNILPSTCVRHCRELGPQTKEDGQEKLCLALWPTHLLPTLAPKRALAHPIQPKAIGCLAGFVILRVLDHEREEINQPRDNQ